ncbi:HNH endonuclease signature motif containing protein [Streptomyces sp. NPDC056638]|uniref:HNH endonuclease signature motif containing protein n=1 Tax=Streptomyces sp. NPDC056638 TaxID=3345887 RepID=UPI0036B5F2F0
MLELDDYDYLALHRLTAKFTVREDGCWQWHAAVAGSTAPRGVISYRGVQTYAYRVSWTLLRGPIPAGLTIDHLCRNPLCVNPDHLEPVTQQVNTQRAVSKDHCKRGHALTDQSKRPKRRPNGVVHWECRECHRVRAAEYRTRRRKDGLGD